MNTYKISDITEGMMFNQAVYVDGENLLVPPNIPLKKKDIERLMKWGIDEIQSEGTIISSKKNKKSSGGANKTDSLLEVLDAQADKELLELYHNSVAVLEDVFLQIQENEKVDNEDIDRVVNTLIPAIKDRKDEMISFLILSGKGKSHLAESSVNTMILSVFLAQSLKMVGHRVNLLAYAALLHDVGMTKVPVKIIEKKEKLTENEIKIIRTHPLYSYKIITKVLRYPEEVGLIALQHHERWDGNGYPKKSSGDNISISSRILSVADAFEAMVSVRPYRNSMIGYKAMRQLLNDNSRRFDSRILKAFIRIMGIYPIGSIVLLNDASIGRVVSTHSDAPLRPIVRLLIDSDGKKYNKQNIVINLLEEKKLFIARAINPHEINEK